MNFYNRIIIWENIRRTNLLKEFLNLIIEYFQNVTYDGYESCFIENVQAGVIRSRINKIVDEVYFIILMSGISPTIQYTPPPYIGGMSRNMELIHNIFNIGSFDIQPRDIMDFIERAIGIYERDKVKAFLRTINPFYWVVLLIDFIVSIPFRILGKVGFDKKKLEDSFLGKIIKGSLYLITVFAAFLTILEKLGYLEWFKKLILK